MAPCGLTVAHHRHRIVSAYGLVNWERNALDDHERTVSEQVDRSIDRLLETFDPRGTVPAEFFGAQFDAGLAFVHFPVGLGGLGLGPENQQRIDERLRDAGAKTAAN